MIDAYPWEIHLGPLPITGFGIMMMLAFLTAVWLVTLECRREGFAEEYAGEILMGAMIGGVVGAKLWYLALHPDSEIFGRGGLVWYGGFVGGTIGVMLAGWRRGVPMRWTAQLLAPAMAAGYAVGRVGCYVVGDDYGVTTTLPWGVRFPDGAPPSTAAIMQQEFGLAIPPGVTPETVMAVHPTQLYEVTIMLAAFAVLWRWRTRDRGTGWLFGAYLIFAGIERFLVEFLRAKDDRFMALTIAQLTSIVLVIVGATTVAMLSGRGRAEPGAYLARAGNGRA